MDYLTAFFNARRIVPIRELNLPLVEIGREKRDRPVPMIAGNRLLSCSKKAGLVIKDEKTFANIELPEYPRPVGILAVSRNSFMFQTELGNAYRVLLNSLDVRQKCTEVFYYTTTGHDSVMNGGCSILHIQVGDGWLAPVHVARKDNDLCEPTWDFLPDVPNYRFSSTENEVIVHDPDGKIYVLDITTGEVRWSKSTEDLRAITSKETQMPDKGSARDYPHIIDNKTIVVGSHLGYLLGVDLESSELIWKKKIEGNAWYPCVNEKGELYKLTGEWRRSAAILKLNARNGEIIEEIDLTNDMVELGLTDLLRDQVYGDVTETHFWGTTTHGLLFAVNLTTGRIDWHQVLGERIPFHNHFVICNNRLYMTTMNQLITFEGAGGYIKDQLILTK